MMFLPSFYFYSFFLFASSYLFHNSILLFLCICVRIQTYQENCREWGEVKMFNFDFSYLKNGSPIVTLSSFGIAFNKGAIESLGVPAQVIIGYDQERHAIGIRARGDDTKSPCYDFASRIRQDWIRIGAKDFMKYLAHTSGIDFLTKSKQFIAEYDENTKTLIVVVDEDHLK